MRTCVLLLALFLGGAPRALLAKPRVAASPTVTLAPDLAFAGTGKMRNLRTLRGQAVVLVIARDPGARVFRQQVKELTLTYQEFASKGVVFVAAFTSTTAGESAVKSNVPFVIAEDGPGVAARYGAGKFQINIIGQDGNLDYQTGKVLPGGRVRDVVQNSYAVQADARKY